MRRMISKIVLSGYKEQEMIKLKNLLVIDSQ